MTADAGAARVGWLWHFCQADRACGVKVPDGQSFCDAHTAACPHQWRYLEAWERGQCVRCGVWGKAITSLEEDDDA